MSQDLSDEEESNECEEQEMNAKSPTQEAKQQVKAYNMLLEKSIFYDREIDKV